MFNNAYQNLELKIDLSSGGTIAGLKEKIKSLLGNKILILCGLLLSGTPKLPAVCEPNIYVTQTEEPDDWVEEEDGEFVPEDVYHLEASNIYGYDIAIEDNVVTCTATQSATYAGVETLIEGGTLENAKPIYIHPIILSNASGEYKISFFIFNNISTAYTTAQAIDYLESLLNEDLNIIRVPTSGSFLSGTNKISTAAYFLIEASGITIFGLNADELNAQNYFSKAGFISYYPTCQDGVNKIN